MRHPLAALLLALSGALAAPPAQADASATVRVNGVKRSLSQTGFIFAQIGGTGVSLGPGQSADYSFDYSLAAHDSGLPAPVDARVNGCLSLHVGGCTPPYTGFEFAKVELLVLYQDARITPPYIQTSGDSTTVVLETHGDSFAEALTQSGTIHVHVSNSDPLASYSQLYGTYVGIWVLAVPEPAAGMQLMVGLGILVVAVRSRSAGWPRIEYFGSSDANFQEEPVEDSR